jgi:uncharacterized protein
MVERTTYLDGEPCWADVMAVDVDAAMDFYGALFGWTFTEAGPDFGDYVLAQCDGRTVAGISPPPPGSETLPSAWTLYLAAHDLDATAHRVEQRDGKIIMGPLAIGDHGRMLFALDPTGAAFGVWEPGRHLGSQLYGEPGALCWAEISTRDAETADAFYRALFDYDQCQIGDGNLLDYTVWSLGGDNRCGRLLMTEPWAGIAPNWMVYFAVDDTDAAAARAKQAGAQLAQPPFDSPHGRIAVLTDPNGATLAVIDPR